MMATKGLTTTTTTTTADAPTEHDAGSSNARRKHAAARCRHAASKLRSMPPLPESAWQDEKGSERRGHALHALIIIVVVFL